MKKLFLIALLLSCAPAFGGGYLGDVPLEETVNFTFNTLNSSGAPVTMGGTPEIEVYEEGGTTQITAADTFTEDFDGVTGLHNVAIAATAANGFEAGKWYDCVIAGTTPTADSVSVAGRVVGRFRVVTQEASAGIPDVNVTLIEDTDATDAINTEADNAIQTYNLDHLMAAAVTGTDVVDDSAIAQIVGDDATADWDSFDNTTDSLEALRIRGDAAWTTGSGTGLTAIDTGQATAGAASTITLASGDTYGTDDLVGAMIFLTGDTGVGQSAIITANTNANPSVLTVSPSWNTTPDATSDYEIWPARVDIASVEGSAASTALLSQSDITGGAYALDTDANGRIRVVDGTAAGEINTASGVVESNAVQISGSATAADNLETAADTNYSATRGLAGTALPAVAAGANGGLPLGDANGRVDVSEWLGTAVATPNTAGVPITDASYFDGDTDVGPFVAASVWNTTQATYVGAGTFGEIATEIASIDTGVNVTSISGSTTAADNAEVVFDTDFATAYDSTLNMWNADIEAANGNATIDGESIADVFHYLGAVFMGDRAIVDNGATQTTTYDGMDGTAGRVISTTNETTGARTIDTLNGTP